LGARSEGSHSHIGDRLIGKRWGGEGGGGEVAISKRGGEKKRCDEAQYIRNSHEAGKITPKTAPSSIAEELLFVAEMENKATEGKKKQGKTKTPRKG